MQLHACLLLLIVTTDKTLALSDHRCGGNISLDQEPTGNISLTLPDADRLSHATNQSDKSLSLCTWLVDIPVGRTIVLKLVQVEGGSSISVRCVGAEEDHDQVLEDEKALLSGCDRNQATLTWTGAGHSSIQLAYYVQEDERNSSTHRPERDLVSWTQTATSFTRTAPVSQGVVRRKGEGRGHLYEGLEWSHGPRSVSGRSPEDPGPPHPTTPLQGPALAGRADRETLPLPEEGPNNGADTSGSIHLTDSPISAREGTLPYYHTQRSLSTSTSNTSSTGTNSRNELAQTHMAPTDAAASNSSAMPAADIHKHTDAHAYKHAATPAQPAVSSFSIPAPSPSLPELPSRATWKSGTLLLTNGGTVSEEKQPHSWTSTNTFSSDLTSAVPSDPVKSHTKPPQGDSSGAPAGTGGNTPTSPSQGPGTAQSSTAHITELHATVSTVSASSFHPNTSRTDSFESTTSEGVSQTAAFESADEFDSTMELRTPTSSSETQTNDVQSTEIRTHSANAPTPFTATSEEARTATQSTQRDFINAYKRTDVVSSSSGVATADDVTSSVTSLSSTSRPALTPADTSADTTTDAGSYGLRPTHTLAHESPSRTSTHSTTPSPTLQTHAVFPDISHATRTPRPLTSCTAVSAARTHRIDRKTTPVPLETSTTKSTSSHPPHTQTHLASPPSATQKEPRNYFTTSHVPPLSLTTARSDSEENGETELEKDDESLQLVTTSTAARSPTAGPPPLSRSTPHPSLLTFTSSATFRSSTTSRPPKYYIVPDQPAAIKVEAIELLLQIVLEDSRSAYAASLEEDTAAWVGPYLQKAPGFSRLLGVWSSGHAVQNLVEFKTSGALQWLSVTGSTSLLERTGLAQAVREARRFRSSKITNVTLGGQQGDVCDWLLQCPSGYECVSQLGTANCTCSSLCHFDYCHHHGICTHHPGQLPVCRCLVGDDFWYMGQRCDMRMTRARLVGACLAILLVIVSVICVLALVAVRRYRAILIQAKVDQTRSSYRRFNHFDELSGRFWLRSWAGSADSLDNPAFTRSDELLHLRALDRPCCYHDDTLSLASTCPSHGMRINTIYPHSSQYAWRGSDMSVGDGVLDSGKASDLSVCSWPVEPIQWTPFPLLQQLASHRTPTVRVSRPRSYCEGMELVDLERSWTA